MYKSSIINNPWLREEATEPATPPAGGNGGNGGEEQSTPPTDGETQSPEYDPGSYGFDEGEPESATDTENGEPENEDAPYEIAWDEDSGLAPETQSLLSEQAKAAGLPADKAASFLNSALGKIAEAEQAALSQSDAELRKEWGRDYEANNKLARATARKLAQSSGLSLDDLAPLQSPKGYKLLHAIAQMTGERRAEGTHTAAPAASPDQELKAMLTDPKHKYNKAIFNPGDPLHREANDYYDKLAGIAGS